MPCPWKKGVRKEEGNDDCGWEIDFVSLILVSIIVLLYFLRLFKVV